MKVNKKRCATCPFNTNGCQSVRKNVEVRIKSGSQLCHHTLNKTLCRGARDVQLKQLHSMGFLSEPTDKAWDAKCAALGIKPNNMKC